MPLTIQVEGINVYGTHGVYDQEKMNGQNFRIDLLIELKENILNFENDFDDDFSESLSEENISNLPEPEDWEKDDGVPLFNSDRFDSTEDDIETDSQLEIPALQRFFGKIKGQ